MDTHSCMLHSYAKYSGEYWIGKILRAVGMYSVEDADQICITFEIVF